MNGLTYPSSMLASVKRFGREPWLDTLPGTIEHLAREWNIKVGEPFQPGGRTAWVAPALRGESEEVVLKVCWRHLEARSEGEALTEWAGRGAVKVLAFADLEMSTALLLERCVPGDGLENQTGEMKDEVIASLLKKLWVKPREGHSYPELGEMCERWADDFEIKLAVGTSRLDAGMAREGIRLFRSLPLTSTRKALLFTDLHAGNVLQAQREPWLAIDPKPHVGDPTYDVLQHMLNQVERLHADPFGFTKRMAELAGLDEQRLRLWLYARCVYQSLYWTEEGFEQVAREIAPR